MKRIIAILLALLTLCAVAQAANGSVEYLGGKEKKWSFEPGSKWSDNDLFDNFKGVMPGDVLTQKITVSNKSNKKVRIYVCAEGATETDREFLNRLHLQVESGSKEIFDAQADEKTQLTKNTLLGTFKQKGSATLTVTLTVPLDLESKFMTDPDRGYVVPWTFMVEEVPDDATPETGDWFNAGAWIGAAILLAGLIVLILAVQQKKKKKA